MKPIDILLVEDNPGDILLVQETLIENKLLNTLHIARDGVEASAFLRREAPFETAPKPDLILLDLNLPRKSGKELLAEIKQDPQLKLIPVIVLTTSNSDRDILESYGLHANAYVTKPVDLDQFIEIVRSIQAFWLSVVQLPDGLEMPQPNRIGKK